MVADMQGGILLMLSLRKNFYVIGTIGDQRGGLWRPVRWPLYHRGRRFESGQLHHSSSDGGTLNAVPIKNHQARVRVSMSGGTIFVTLVLVVAAGLLTSILMEVFWSK
jgi:hypothetical protein